jgi:hypothetical protein
MSDAISALEKNKAGMLVETGLQFKQGHLDERVTLR